VHAILALVIGAILLGGCAAKQNAVSAQNPSETTTPAGKPLASDASKMARESSPGVVAGEDYERAVADYNNCVVEHTANLSACEKQRAIMNADEKALSRTSPSQSNKIINMER
jgi:hypothetical protein